MLCLKLFYVFFKVGLFGFGGGYAMLPLIYQDIKTFDLMSPHEFSNVVALSQVTPGPIAVNAATYVGFRSAGFWGAFWATIGVSLPSLLIILSIMAFLKKFQTNPKVQGVLSGIRPATVGMIAAAVIFFAKTSIVREGFFSLKVMTNLLAYVNIPALVIFAVTIILTVKLKMGPIAMTILAGLLGILIF